MMLRALDTAPHRGSISRTVQVTSHLSTTPASTQGCQSNTSFSNSSSLPPAARWTKIRISDAFWNQGSSTRCSTALSPTTIDCRNSTRSLDPSCPGSQGLTDGTSRTCESRGVSCLSTCIGRGRILKQPRTHHGRDTLLTKLLLSSTRCGRRSARGTRVRSLSIPCPGRSARCGKTSGSRRSTLNPFESD